MTRVVGTVPSVLSRAASSPRPGAGAQRRQRAGDRGRPHRRSCPDRAGLSTRQDLAAMRRIVDDVEVRVRALIAELTTTPG